MSENRKCSCALCVKWGPLHRRILKKLRGNDRKLFEEFLMMEMQQSDDLGAANAKLDGDWPGWGWMKVAVPLMQSLRSNRPSQAKIDTFDLSKNA